MNRVIYIFYFCMIIYSCSNKSPDPVLDQSEINERLTGMNKILVGNESKRIDEFIMRHSFNMQRTGTGLRYQVYHHGTGNKPGFKSIVEINYKIFLLDGTLCYSNDSGPGLKINLGIGEQVHGLEEGLVLMSAGDKARFVIPSHLAYGMQGDQNKIPPSSALFIDVELIKVVQ